MFCYPKTIFGYIQCNGFNLLRILTSSFILLKFSVMENKNTVPDLDDLLFVWNHIHEVRFKDKRILYRNMFTDKLYFKSTTTKLLKIVAFLVS